MIRVLLVDDQKTIREALRAMLDSAPDLQVVGTASDGYTAIEQVSILSPDVVLIDMEMPGLDGVSATRIISQKFEGVKVLVLSMHDDEALIAKSVQAGAIGYLLKDTPPQELRAAIRFVKRGYALNGPGLLDKFVAAGGVSEPNGHHKEGYSHKGAQALGPLYPIKHGGEALSQTDQPSRGLEQVTASELDLRNGYSGRGEPSEQSLTVLGTALSELEEQTPSKYGKWRRYLILGALLNVVLWGGAIAVLKFKPRVYTSAWTLDLPAARSDTIVEVPGVGRAAQTNDSPYNNFMVVDPRANYKDILDASEVLKGAAKRLNIPTDEFTPPKVEVVPNTTLIKLAVNGDSPRDAYQRAIAIQASFDAKLGVLRKQELNQQDKNLKTALDSSAERLKVSQQRLSSYKVQVGLDSGEQLRDLSANIETLRRQRAEIVGEMQDSANQLSTLSANLGLSTQQAADAFILQSDSLFQQYSLGYSKISAELTSLESAYANDHPKAVDKAEEKNAAHQQLFQRGKQLLGHSIDESTLQLLNVTNGVTDTRRSALFEELITLKGKAEGSRGQAAELGQQVAQLEDKMTTLSKKKSILVNLERDVQIAEAIFTSTLGKLDLTKSSFSLAYPEVTIRTQPSLPKLPSSPKVLPILLGTFLASIFISSGLVSLWYRDLRLQQLRLQKLQAAAAQPASLAQLQPSPRLQSLPGQP